MLSIYRKSSAVIFLFIVSLFILAGCGGSSGGEDGTTSEKRTAGDGASQTSDTVVISDNATALEDPQSVKQLTDISEDGLTLKFSDAPKEVKELKPGKVISLPPTGQAPTGLLRKVVAVNEVGGETEVKTERASLTDVIEQGEFKASGTLQPPSALIQSASSNQSYGAHMSVLHRLEGVTFQHAANEVRALAIESPDTLPFVLGLDDVVIYDDDGNPNTKNDQVVASGKIGFSVDFDIKGDINFFKLQTLNFTATATEISELSIRSAQSASFEKSTTIWSARLPSIKVLIGGWPLWITPEIDVVVSADGQVTASVMTGATGKITASSGISYVRDRATPWMPVAEKASDFELMPVEVNANASATVSAGPAIKFLIYDLVGPKANLEGYLTLAANVLDDPWWRIYGGIRAGAGVTLEILDRTIADVMYPDIVDYQIEIAKAESGLTPLPDVPNNLSISRQSSSAVLSWNVVEGASAYALYYKTSPSVVPGTTGVTKINVSDSNFVHSGRTPGQTYYYRVTAVNAAGESQTSSEVNITFPATEETVDPLSGLIAHYKFEGNANDSSINSNHGTEVGGVTYTTGVVGKAARFDGLDDYIKGSGIDINSNDYTIASWIKLDNSCSNVNTIFSLPSHGLNDNAIHFDFKCDIEALASYIYNDQRNVSDTLSIINSWNHVVVEKSGESLSLYLNGSKINDFQVEQAIDYGATRGYLIGADDDFGGDGNGDVHWFKGLIDDLRIYNRALTDLEISELYGEYAYSHGNFFVTSETYSETDKNDQACKNEFGSNHRLADWNDVVDYYQSGASMTDFFDNLGLPAPGTEGSRSLMVSRDGIELYSSTRHYFISRHDHNKPGNYLAHDNIDNYLISLGSWYGARPVLCYEEDDSGNQTGSVLYSEDFSSDPSFTSYSATHAYWDLGANNYYVQTKDNLNYKYWAHSGNIGNIDPSSQEVDVTFDIMIENQNWGTYPNIGFYSSIPTEMTDSSRVFFMQNANADNSRERFGTCTYAATPAKCIYNAQWSVDNNVWYTVRYEIRSAGTTVNWTVTEKSTGDVITNFQNQEFPITSFSYIGIGYYNQPDYGSTWAPMRIDNISITAH